MSDASTPAEPAPAQSLPPVAPVFPPPPAAPVATETAAEPTVSAATEPIAKSEPEPVAKSEPEPEPAVTAEPEPVAQAKADPEAPAPDSPAGAPGLKTRATALIAATQATPRRKALVGVGLAAVALLLLGAIGYTVWDRFIADPLRNAVTGHCIAGLPIVEAGEDREVGRARLVHCTDEAAVYLVEGRLDGVTEEESRDREICRGYRQATDIYRAVPPGGTGYVLCLSRVDA